MATNGEVIGDALRDIDVIADGQSLPAEMGLYGLRKLNNLMESWIDDDIDLAWFEQDNVNDDFPLPDAQKRVVIVHLAIEMAPKYGVSVPPELAKIAFDSYQTLTRKALVARLEPANMDHMPMGAVRHRSNIETDDE